MSVSILPHIVRARQAAPSGRKPFHLRRRASHQWMYLTYKGTELDDVICYRPVECGNVVGQECQTFLSADFGDRNRDRRQALAPPRSDSLASSDCSKNTPTLLDTWLTCTYDVEPVIRAIRISVMSGLEERILMMDSDGSVLLIQQHKSPDRAWLHIHES